MFWQFLLGCIAHSGPSGNFHDQEASGNGFNKVALCCLRVLGFGGGFWRLDELGLLRVRDRQMPDTLYNTYSVAEALVKGVRVGRECGVDVGSQVSEAAEYCDSCGVVCPLVLSERFPSRLGRREQTALVSCHPGPQDL